MNMDQAIETFMTESAELLAEMEHALLELEQRPDDSDLINAVFRAAHTIKGSAGLFGFDEVVAFTHVAESVLDRVRDGEVRVDDALIALLLGCRDHMITLIGRAQGGDEDGRATCIAAGQVLIQRLGGYLDGGACATRPAAAQAEQAGATDLSGSRRPYPEGASGMDAGRVGGEGSTNRDLPKGGRPGMVGIRRWRVGLGFGEDMLRHGMDPASVLRHLAQLGEISDVWTSAARLPRLAEMDAESCYLDVTLTLASDRPVEEIEGAFDFIREETTVSLAPLDDEAAGDAPEVVAVAAPPVDEPSASPRVSGAEAMDGRGGRGQDEPLELAAGSSDGVGKQAASAARSVRIDAAKLDELINLVGELVIASASSHLITQRFDDEALVESMSVMSRLVEEIRDSALRLRMVPIGETFARFRRVVRDVSQDLGKDIRLEIQGADTELDKTVVEKIGDPLMHLVRNAMDHGIEPADRRLPLGKPAHGTLRLNAYHDAGSIVIEVADDGGGLNRDKIIAKAIAKGLLAPNAALTDQEAYRLIFEPGFSTADQVTNLSGRGVGMDVVKKNIEALRGAVDIDSRPGEGTTVSIRLPLTLGIIDGFLVRVSDAAYVIPLDMVMECIELPEGDRAQSRSRHYLNLRGEVLPFVRLRELFHGDGRPAPRENVVVVHYGGHKAGLVVDELMGEFQTVIKPLGKIFERLRGVSGATILGSGEVSMILDVPSLVEVAAQRSKPRLTEIDTSRITV
ncbi:MAG: chemotaxis protein CheA [Pseudomonadota bacterium]